ncbi:hypothetical protein ABMA46_08680 [Mesorhizobium sp. CN5-321]|jgi:hypothetical protein|uniref:hypothetical protein n=1 Tax=Mesorhizobium hunchu TaxID=3157708 RepID=UPI0032B79B2B
MSFSQAWDAGFRAVLIYIGVVFAWLGLVEQYFGSQSVSVVVMNVVAVALALAFFLRARSRAVAERARAEAEVRALMEEAV